MIGCRSNQGFIDETAYCIHDIRLTDALLLGHRKRGLQGEPPHQNRNTAQDYSLDL